MANHHIDAFMKQVGYEGLTFNDVSLVTKYADFLPDSASVETKFSRNIKLNIPFVSAAMDTVTESKMAIAIAMLGGIGVIHKNLPPKRQAAEVDRVKHYLNGLIRDAVFFRQNMTVQDVLDKKAAHDYNFTGFPILDDNDRIVGILTARDLKFAQNFQQKVSEVMTKDLITGTESMSITDAYKLMIRERVGKLPIIDDDNKLIGLYSFQDVKTIIENDAPIYNRDAEHKLRVAAAIGPNDDERIEALAKVHVDAMIVDTAHGHSKGVIDTVKRLKKDYPHIDIVAGNIATEEAAEALMKAGADAVKVGIGPGSICTTRIVAGVGIPQLTAIYRAKKAVQNEIPVIADGGVSYSGDAAKALAIGGSSVMMGSALAGTDESPGERILHQGRTFVAYRGMGSLDAMKTGKGSRERYGQKDVDSSDKLVPQGIEAMIPYRGPLAGVLHQFVGGVRYSLGYCGAQTIPQLQENAEFVKVSQAGQKEAHPHDVNVVKDAPNYRAT